MTENLASALAAFQAELPKLNKGNTADAGTYKYQYADLADVSSVVLPLLAKHGLSFSAKPTLDEGGRFVLEYVLRHAGGDSDGGSYPLPSGSPQQIGSAITYARRYVLSAMTGIAPDADDDGKAANDTRIERVPEPHWDPIEQETLTTAWTAEVARVQNLGDLTDILRRIKRSRDLSPASKDRLSQVCVNRRVELEQGSAA